MRVIRRRGNFGTKVDVVGAGPVRPRATPELDRAFQEISRALDEPAPIILARLLERRIGKGGGLRDPLPGDARERYARDQYLTLSIDRSVKEWIQQQSDARGYARGSFVGAIVEAVKELDDDTIDDLLAGDLTRTKSQAAE